MYIGNFAVYKIYSLVHLNFYLGPIAKVRCIDSESWNFKLHIECNPYSPTYPWCVWWLRVNIY